MRKGERGRTTIGFEVARMVAIAIGLALLGAPAQAVERRCVTAQVDDAMVMPDGSFHPSGTLTLCDSREISPVSALHETRVNGRAIGMFVSRVRVAETGSDVDPVAVFQRRSDGRLALIGYSLPGQGRSVSYQLANAGERDAAAEDLLVMAMR